MTRKWSALFASRHHLIAAALFLFGTQSLLPASAYTDNGRDKNKTILSLPIGSFHVSGADMEEALTLLRRKDYTTILIGFEKVPGQRDTKDEKGITLELKNTDVAEVLDALCHADPRYTYEIIHGVLVNVLPKGAKEDHANLLNRHVHRLSLKGAYTPEGVIRGIGELVPELREYLRERADVYFARKGVVPGSPGALGTGNLPREFHLELEDGTVRDVLNAVVLYSMKAFQENAPDPTGWRTPPSSWKYEFTVDPEASTGLGGIPHWDTLD